MLKSSNGDSRLGQESPLFFQEVIVVPNRLNPSEFVVHQLPATGIPMRDYFAAHALATCIDSFNGAGLDSASSVAEWCYRIADKMIEARRRESNSQFHEDHMKGQL
jgi:hypothetical protein